MGKAIAFILLAIGVVMIISGAVAGIQKAGVSDEAKETWSTVNHAVSSGVDWLWTEAGPG